MTMVWIQTILTTFLSSWKEERKRYWRDWCGRVGNQMRLQLSGWPTFIGSFRELSGKSVKKRKLRSLSKNKRNFEKAGTITKSTAQMCKVFFFIKPEWEMDEKKIKASLQSWMTPLQYTSFSITMDAFCECIHGKLPPVSMLVTKVLDDPIEKPSHFKIGIWLQSHGRGIGTIITQERWVTQCFQFC